MKELQKNRLLIIIIIIVAIEAIFFSVNNFKLNEEAGLKDEHAKKVWEILEGIPVEAEAVSIYNITEDKKLFGKNDDISMPIASLAKTMTVVIGLNNYSLDKILLISLNALYQAGDYGLFLKEKWEMDDLAKFTLIASANDGAYTLAENDSNFLEKMNDKARRIGMDSALFLSPTGLDFVDFLELSTPIRAGAFATAEDANLMAIYGLRAYPEIFSVTTLSEINLTSVSGFTHNFKNTNKIIGKIPNLLFSKTGYTEIAGGNLTVIFENKKGQSIAVTVLGSGFESRFSDMERIVETLYDY